MVLVHTRSPRVLVIAAPLLVGVVACRAPVRPDGERDAATAWTSDASTSLTPQASVLPLASAAPSAKMPDAGAIKPPRADAPILVSSDAQFRCSSPSTPASLKITASSQRVRVEVAGQGPCPGEVEGWNVEVREPKLGGFIRIASRSGTPSRCLCHGDATFEVARVPAGTYRVEVAGGFNRSVRGDVTVPP
ncbi:MAG: hypothetical protein JWM74_4475 [Myxococcaceae bacterium]|nr:hypothetical protein [Myxococcaceae bacterium]